MSESQQSESRKSPRARLSLRKRMAFLGALVLMVLLGAELCARLAGYPKGVVRSTLNLWAKGDARALGPFTPGARATIAWPPELAYTVEVNALGLRGRVPDPGRQVVLCVGDSTTFGANVAEDATYPVLLERRLPGAAVVNGGCPRWTITDEDDFLAAALPALRPRVVVLLFCGNDLRELDKRSAADRAAESSNDLGSGLALPDLLLAGWLRVKRAGLKAAGRWPEEMRDDQRQTAEIADGYWTRWADGLAKFQARCVAAHVPLVVAAFPGFGEVEGATCAVESRLPPLVQASGATYVDLYAPFRASPQGRFLLPFDPHASPSGNELIAETIAPVVARLLETHR